ncbi:hypothetical protein [Streptomyces luteocolor]|uniref:hypothetical protein n=1 Tax=Streptomyces luteocolor TaxID=285500 RepID=UPI0008537215|nr:hypothetical protein [Streptomyces luteocolor]
MTVLVCSLKSETLQSIPNDGDYHVVRFPPVGEPCDVHGMHQQAQPDGYEIRDWARDDRSGLIWPACPGWGSLTAVLYWEEGDYTEVRDRFVRDPLGLTTGYDSTATEDHPPTGGGQFLHKSHELFVDPGTPLAVLVRHNASRPRRLTLAEFKLAIHPT